MQKGKRKLGIIFFPAYDWAISPTHPERQERLLYTQDQLREEGLFDIENIHEYKPLIAKNEDIQRVHFCFPDVEHVVTESHRIASGGAVRAVQLVMEGEADRAFAMVRPPGHHAMKSVHGNRGFCNINNEAIMLEYLREHYRPKKIAIVDTDCHHGDGTQDIYWHDPDVLFISLHQDGRTLFPGSGFVNEQGGPNAPGKNINIPLPPGTTDQGFLYVLDNVVLPILDDFKPDIIINSAGQDNHYSDPITNMNFSAQGYAALNDRLNPDICVLEGGYSIHGALPYINLGIILAMAGLDYSYVREPDYRSQQLKQDRRITDHIEKLCETAKANYFRKKVKYRVGEYVKRNKEIFYDTEYFLERQTESVRVCDACPGLLVIETESAKVPLSLGIEVPFRACGDCYQEGLQLIESVRGKANYYSVSVINRWDKTYGPLN